MASWWTVVYRLFVYLALILIPVIVVTVYCLTPEDLFAYNLGRCSSS